jgi:hypothetical protein
MALASVLFRSLVIALLLGSLHSAVAREFMTRNLKKYGQPEIRFEVSDQTPAADVEWLNSTLEDMVAKGKRFEDRDSVQIGWIRNRLQTAPGNTLRLLEPDFVTLPLKYQPTMTNTLRTARLQKDTVANLEGDWTLTYPFMDQTALVHQDYSKFVTLSLQRVVSYGQDSGWRLLAPRDSIGNVTAARYRSIPLYELALRRPEIVPLLGLPTGVAVKIGADQQKTFTANSGKPIPLRTGANTPPANANAKDSR